MPRGLGAKRAVKDSDSQEMKGARARDATTALENMVSGGRWVPSCAFWVEMR